MEQFDRRDLPGNDASWYLSLLLDEDRSSDVAAEVPVQQSLLLSPPLEAVEQQPDEQPLETVDTETPDGELAQIEESTEERPPGSDQGSEHPDETEPESEASSMITAPAPIGDDEPVELPAEDLGADSETPQEEAPNSDLSPLVSVVPEVEAPIDNTSEMIGQLWTASEPESPFDDWEPEEIDNKVTSRRPFRWTSIIAVLAVIALIVVGLVLLPSITRSRATQHREMLTAAMWELRRELPDAQVSLEIATEPTATVPQLNDLSTQLTVFSAKATVVDEAARTPLPSAPPLTSSQPIDDLAPIQQRLEPLATTAHTIQRRISDLVEYRTLMDGFLDLPELPTEADNSAQADLRVILASAQAQSAAILTDLPGDVSLSEHSEMARSINDVFSTWQIDYLEALRAQDPVEAEQLIADLQVRLINLDAALVDPLAQIRRQTDTDLIDLARDIDDVMALAEGEEPAQ